MLVFPQDPMESSPPVGARLETHPHIDVAVSVHAQGTDHVIIGIAIDRKSALLELRLAHAARRITGAAQAFVPGNQPLLKTRARAVRGVAFHIAAGQRAGTKGLALAETKAGGALINAGGRAAEDCGDIFRADVRVQNAHSANFRFEPRPAHHPAALRIK